MTQLFERERELAQLREMVDAARDGRGCLAVIEAPAGLGKTRLLQAARESGREAGMQVLAARATELEQGFPFAIVRQLLGPRLAGPDREELLDGVSGPARGALGLDEGSSGDAFAVLHGLYWLTAALAEQQPLLLAIDDAHWADAASLDFLGFLVPRLEELPVLLAVACRPGEGAARDSLERIATDPQAQRLTPRTLSANGAAVVLAEGLGQEPEQAFAAICHDVSGGNPFLLNELARTLAIEQVSPVAAQATRVHELVPERVTRTVHVRLARLSPDAQAVARAVVVLGDDADGQLVAELAELEESLAAHGADELRAASILDPGATLRFIHPLVRAALDSQLPAGERAALHARAVELLRARGADPQRLAVHLVATDARNARETVETLLEAGTLALAGGAPRSAAAYLIRALREPAPEDLRLTTLGALVTAGIRAPDRELFAELLPQVMRELDRDDRLLVRWAPKVSTWLTFNGRADDAVPLLERAVAAAREHGDVATTFRLAVQPGLIVQRPLPETRARLSELHERIPPDSATGRMAAAFAAEWHAFDGTAAEAVQEARLALAHDGRIFDEQPEMFAPGRVVMALILADELDLAQRAAEQALASARRRNATAELVSSWWLNGGVAFARGDLAAAEADIRQALAVARLGRLAFAELPLRAVVMGLLLARGEVDAAEAELQASGMAGEIPQGVWFALNQFGRGLLRYEQGRYEEAAADLLEVERVSICWGAIGMPGPPVRISAARAVAALGDRERARAKAEAALDHARHWGTPALLSQALSTLALTLDASDRVAPLEEAVAVLDGTPARLVRAQALADFGAALRRAGRRADARPPLREALALARRCGAAGLARRVADELRATGEKVRRYTPIGVESLTPSERRVAELAASGLTNRQIAQSLFVTVKTVETHLAAAYDKLGIGSRRQLPAALST